MVTQNSGKLMENYNLIQKILHDILLSNRFIKKSLFEIEKIFYLKKSNLKVTNSNHLFITGLPRSGTTILLNFFYNTDKFTSLLYKNMPFVMSPNLFDKFNKEKKFEKKERPHKDGIYVDLNSPESFDEIFFSSFSEKEIINEFPNYLKLILLNSKNTRYLSKNNFNYKRIGLILSILPQSIFLLPFRDPIQHSKSLLMQHEHFLKLQNKNSFIKRYMNYLGHKEFGLLHKSWNEPIKYKNISHINYWLEQWYLFYSNLFSKFKENNNCYFVKYESLNSFGSNENISVKFDVKFNSNFKFNIKIRNINENFDIELLNKAKKLYSNMESYEINNSFLQNN